ncbi:16S rRNA (guanine(527)-N(7))-methyltransferase RsmG [Croceicoccus estronivorus]|uniref:16S rRNA (guanine(527)-N(7))-methyltransferase RsmG n=1 Tax=Croceicoccus estronivorus TaxID=1172626 RepID=UPI000829C563|nr:16S rRNA (guanine(527)-N(7))-methyltransferase RsmG [Croceicoccus estronivorus]OCC24003.1 16S rRNA (guanine(527)-N(7))-methyltransferase RsmG [Croceicoccus estronivorus]
MIRNEEEARSYTATHCDFSAMQRLDRLVALLSEENERQNLIARQTVPHLWQRHIADSAQLLRYVSRETGVWLDLGTGAGFPGLVIAAMRPSWPVKLVESRKRRAEWLEFACDELNLRHCEVLGQRLENIDSFAAGVISARAFAPMPRLMELSSRFSTAQTLWLLPKGRSAEQDLNALPKSRRNAFHVEQSLTDPEAGIIIGGGPVAGIRPEARQAS